MSKDGIKSSAYAFPILCFLNSKFQKSPKLSPPAFLQGHMLHLWSHPSEGIVSLWVCEPSTLLKWIALNMKYFYITTVLFTNCNDDLNLELVIIYETLLPIEMVFHYSIKISA